MIQVREYAHWMLGGISIFLILMSASFAQDGTQPANQVSAQDLVQIQGQIAQIKKVVSKQSAIQQEQASTLKSQLKTTDDKVGALNAKLDSLEIGVKKLIVQANESSTLKVLLMGASLLGLFALWWLVKLLKGLFKDGTSKHDATQNTFRAAAESSQVNAKNLNTQNPEFTNLSHIQSNLKEVKLNQKPFSDVELNQLIANELDQTQHTLDLARKSFMTSPDISIMSPR